MKTTNKISKYILSTLITSLLFSTSLQNTYAESGLKFKDVSDDHWAYTHIESMAKAGYLMGDTSSNYNPSSYIDKFETARILAMISGYKTDNEDVILNNYANKAYEKNADILNAYADIFSTWNNTTDRAIAYLIEREILDIEELATFIDKNDDIETLSFITKGEIASYFVKLLDLEDVSLETKYNFTFNDDNEIDENIKNYTYYMHFAKIMDIDQDGNFNADAPISKSVFAMYLDKLLNIFAPEMGITLSEFDNKQHLEVSFSDTNNFDEFDKIETMHATFDKLVNLGSSNLNAMQLILNDGTVRIYKYASDIAIILDDYLKTPLELVNGMQITLTLNNDEIVEINASFNEQTQDMKTSKSQNLNSSANVITGIIEEIFVSKNAQSYIVLSFDSEFIETQKYSFLPNKINILSVGVGSEVEITLEEDLISFISLLDDNIN